MWTPNCLAGGIDVQLARAREHYDKYEALAQSVGLGTLKAQVASIIGSGSIRRVAMEPSSIHILDWDAKAHYWHGKKNPLKPGFTFSLSEGVCMLKHVASHHVGNLPRPDLSDAERAWYAEQDIYDPKPFYLTILRDHVRAFAEQNKATDSDWAKVAEWSNGQIMHYLHGYHSPESAVSWIWENIAPRSQARFAYMLRIGEDKD